MHYGKHGNQCIVDKTLVQDINMMCYIIYIVRPHVRTTHQRIKGCMHL